MIVGLALAALEFPRRLLICTMQKELVMQRLSNEEMESELVRYKLLYASSVLRRSWIDES